LVFVDASEDSVMANDVVMPLNPPVALVKEEELEELSLDVNVSQWPCDEESFQIVVRTQIHHSMWDRQLSPNPHALVIYLEFFLTCGATLEKFEECQCENDDVRLHCRTWVLGDGHYRWLRGPINPLFMEHRVKYLTRTIHRILDFLRL